ncbi:hypothetical protein CALVIDRAFT_554289 [Calocera viscosa TUFC12733]|uniref:BRCT domain-containing protein n=1 Tax=Calocera viscosa (strain TUFC12733) TaxID=1330018 RepID=A0A167NJC0_CALVF|nr:hypothetical protein CALVIDRAFT_554289 [Calocera viscosa TUFC12733]
MASFPDIESQEVLAYAYGSSTHAPHLQPGWVDSQPPPPPAPPPLPVQGDTSTQPLYLPHEFDDSTAPSNSHSGSGSGSTSGQVSHSFTGSSSLSIPHVRPGAHIDYTSSESGGSFASGGTTAGTAAAGWTMETNVDSLPAGSSSVEGHQHQGGSADNEAAQSEHILAGAGSTELKSDNGLIGATTSQHADIIVRDTHTYMRPHPHPPLPELLPPFASQEYVLPPPFTLSLLNHPDASKQTPSTRATTTTAVPSAASGILTPVSEVHSSAPKPAIGEDDLPRGPSPAPPEDSPMQIPTNARARAGTPSVKSEVPETPPSATPAEETSAELGESPRRRGPSAATGTGGGAREHKFLPRKGERPPSPVPLSRESSFGLMSPKTRYLDEAGRREREEEREREREKQGRGRGRRGKKPAQGEPDSRKSKKPSSAAERNPPRRSPTPDDQEPEETDLSAANALPTQPSTTTSSLVRRSFATIFPPPLDLAALPQDGESQAPRTGTTGTGAGLGLLVGSGQRVLVESSSSAPLVEEPEHLPEEDEAGEESARADPGSSSRRVEHSTPSRGTRETRTSKGSAVSAPPSQARKGAEAALAHLEPDEGVQGTQEAASPSQRAPVTPPRNRGKRARQGSVEAAAGPAKRRKAEVPRTPNKAKVATRVYSAKKKRKGGEEEEEEQDGQEEESQAMEKPTLGQTRSKTNRSNPELVGPEEPATKPASKGAKRKADKLPSDAESIASKRPRRGTSQHGTEPSEPDSVASRRPSRGQAQDQNEDQAESLSASRPRRKAAVKKPGKATAGKGKAPEVIQEEPETLQDSAVQLQVGPESEIQLDVAAEDEPTPSPAIRAGAPFSRVFAAWNADKCYYPATVTGQVTSGRQAGQFNVDFDDGSVSCVSVDSLRAAVLKEGDTIAIQKGRKWREGRIMEGAFGTVQRDTLVRVRFDEGSQSTEKSTVALLRIPKIAVVEWDDRKLTSEQVTPQVVVKREGEEKRKRSATGGPGGSVSDSPALPTSQRHRSRPTSSVLEGHAFIVTAKEDKSKQDLVRRIEQASGEVSEDFADFFDISEQRIVWKGADRGLTAVWCIAREVSTTPKYLMALALGVPCLGYKFISDVLDKKTTVEEWAPYLLSAGRSEYHETDCSQKVDRRWGENDADEHTLLEDILASPHICRPLRNKRILFIVSKKDTFFKDRLVEVLWAMGAEHVEKTPAVSLDEDLNSFDFLYWPDEVEMKITLPKAKKAKMVGPNWVKQCLITGLCVPVE